MVAPAARPRAAEFPVKRALHTLCRWPVATRMHTIHSRDRHARVRRTNQHRRIPRYIFLFRCAPDVEIGKDTRVSSESRRPRRLRNRPTTEFGSGGRAAGCDGAE